MLTFPRFFGDPRRREFHHCVYICVCTYTHTHVHTHTGSMNSHLTAWFSQTATYPAAPINCRRGCPLFRPAEQKSHLYGFFVEKRAYFESLQLRSGFWDVFLRTSKPVWSLHVSHYRPKAPVHRHKDMNLESWLKFVLQFRWSAQFLCNSLLWVVRECLWLYFSHHQFKEAE